jgi:hypothetical protein
MAFSTFAAARRASPQASARAISYEENRYCDRLAAI